MEIKTFKIDVDDFLPGELDEYIKNVLSATDLESVTFKLKRSDKDDSVKEIMLNIKNKK